MVVGTVKSFMKNEKEKWNHKKATTEGHREKNLKLFEIFNEFITVLPR